MGAGAAEAWRAAGCGVKLSTMALRRALLLSCLMALALPVLGKGKKGSAKKKEPPKKESKYISASPDAGKHVYRFDRHGRPVVKERAGGEKKEGAETEEPSKAGKKKRGKKAAKEAVKKESKYISPSADAGRSVYRFDEHGRPIDGGEGKKKKEEGKKDPKPR